MQRLRQIAFGNCAVDEDQSRQSKIGADDPAAPPSIEPATYFTPTYPEPVVREDTVRDILQAAAPNSMVHVSGLEFLIHDTVRLIRAGIPGAIVECGVWKGGAALACLLAQRSAFGKVERPVYLLDSFEGLPSVTSKDGPLAALWQAGEDAERFMDNCRAAEGDVHRLLYEHNFHSEDAIIVKGWFSDTATSVAAACQRSGIALLRLDGDWYDSTTQCLEPLEPCVSEGGTIIIDDYYAWDGCARAVHDYLSRHDLQYRIKSLYRNFGAYMVKRKHRASYEEF
jgi:hypothetical protein